MIPIIISAYEPDSRLITLLNQLVEISVESIILVNDGSGEEYNSIFLEANRIITKNDGIVINHDVNKGKGRALKTAIEFALN